ncbi:MAG: sigma-54-dependent transcriptional regulator [Rhodospirillales bacterium]|tara:strand:+ start:33141 stop:34535 length:1395 start_codon:yes stop_codon:yes gene_type:complete
MRDILIVDDQADIRILAAGILEDEGYETRIAHNSKSAFSSVASRRPSLVLLDIWLQDPKEGLEILEKLCLEHPTLPVVMMSGHGNIETAVKAINIGAFDFIEKPFTADRLILVIDRALENAKLKRENADLKLRVGGEIDLIGESSQINQLRQSVNRVANSNSRVLITGPAGSGKDVIARLLHRNSIRSDSAFVKINCATMNPDSFESSLFGSENPDSQTESKTIGTFEQAHNGTLFFDEVADMPLETQGKIVRTLQEQTFTRVGGTKFIEVDVRVISSSTKDLSEQMKKGYFREDLFYRLSVVPVEIPPLKNYREDIPELAKFFMDQIADLSGRLPREFSDEALATLQCYEWPGNVRELRNVIERILIMAPGNERDPITLEMMPNEMLLNINENKVGVDKTEFMSLQLRDAREIFEREYLEAQIMRFGGNISKTANFIGMERSALHRKIKYLGLQSNEKMIVNE